MGTAGQVVRTVPLVVRGRDCDGAALRRSSTSTQRHSLRTSSTAAQRVMASRSEKGGTYKHLHKCTACGEARWVTRGVHRRMDVHAVVRRHLPPPLPLTTTLTTLCVLAALRLWLRLEGGGPAPGSILHVPTVQ